MTKKCDMWCHERWDCKNRNDGDCKGFIQKDEENSQMEEILERTTY